MISKPLFKQSCKANAVTWTFVTVITSFMLAILIVVMGGIDVNSIRHSMVDMFVTDAVEANVQKQSITYFDMTTTALTNYEQNKGNLTLLLNGIPNEQRTQIGATYDLLIQGGKTHEEAKETILSTIPEAQNKILIGAFVDYYKVNKNNIEENNISAYVLGIIGDSVYNEVLKTQGEESANIAKLFIGTAINDYLKSGINDTNQFSLNYIPTVLAKVFVGQEINNDGEIIKIKDYYKEEELVEISNTSIISYTAQMTFMFNEIKNQVHTGVENGTIDLGGKTEEQLVQERMLEYKNKYITDNTGTLLEQFPTDVAEALQELGSMDIYSLVIGSIFFRIAGLLLPIIYIIMTSNNLIATQVDTGSMAFILSTPIKRKTVSLTQMLYLIVSLFGMFVCTTITGVIALAATGSYITITITDMLLFNLGAFITTFAISGICYLASSWFNRSKQSMAVGGGLSMFFLVATILGLFGSSVMPQAIKIDAMNAFNYVSLISLFDTVSIIDGTLTFLWKWAILLVVGVVTYFIAIKKFKKKDLPL